MMPSARPSRAPGLGPAQPTESPPIHLFPDRISRLKAKVKIIRRGLHDKGKAGFWDQDDGSSDDIGGLDFRDQGEGGGESEEKAAKKERAKASFATRTSAALASTTRASAASTTRASAASSSTTRASAASSSARPSSAPVTLHGDGDGGFRYGGFPSKGESGSHGSCVMPPYFKARRVQPLAGECPYKRESCTGKGDDGFPTSAAPARPTAASGKGEGLKRKSDDIIHDGKGDGGIHDDKGGGLQADKGDGGKGGGRHGTCKGGIHDDQSGGGSDGNGKHHKTQRGTKHRGGKQQQEKRAMLMAHPDTADCMGRLFGNNYTADDMAYLKQVFGQPQLDAFIEQARLVRGERRHDS